MTERFFAKLKQGVILCDGAMGTQLYQRGAYINQCYESLNLSQPNWVADIHQAYIKAGAQIIETNTFGANRLRLQGFGLAAQTREINAQGVALARRAAQDQDVLVAGAIGPLGQMITPRGTVGLPEARAIFTEQIQVLIESGVDLLLFESFGNIEECALAVEVARSMTNLPLIAQASFDARGVSDQGFTVEQFICAGDSWPVAALGFNCSTGPSDMLAHLERAVKLTQKPISCMPNAGLPRMVEGRNIYLASPEYMAEYAKRFILTGAQLVGGCCGTAAEHIKAMRSAIRALFPGKRLETATGQQCMAAAQAEAPLANKSHWARCLSEGKFLTSVEITPPRSADPAATLEKCRALKAAGIDGVNIPDGPRASARLSPMILSLLIQQQVGIEVILHYTCRDRNILGMQSDLLGLYAGGVRNLLIVTGDPPKMGDYPEATAVFDVDAIGLTRMVTALNRGLDIGGNPIPAALGFCKGVGVNPGAINLDLELERLRQKIAAGAEFVITQPVFDPELFFRFKERIRDLAIPVIAGVWPLASFKNAEFMNNEVPGASVPKEIMERMAAKGSGPEAQAEGVRIAGEALAAIRSEIQGVQVSAAFGKVELALEVMRQAGVL